MKSKYFSVFKISFEAEFAYRLNFIMWRVRNVLSIFVVFFLWDTIFANPGREVFGYDRAKILTYIFGLIIMRSVVLSIRSVDVPGEIARGELSNYLIKPLSYFKYWFTRDIGSKGLNLIFAIFESTILFLILKPPFFLQTNIVYILLFLCSVVLAVVLYFFLVFMFTTPVFWFPEQAWGMMFLLFTVVDLFGGGVFPIDILPAAFQKILYLTPFPYLLFVPVQIYLGKISPVQTVGMLLVGLSWLAILAALVRYLWSKGLKVYGAEGR